MDHPPTPLAFDLLDQTLADHGATAALDDLARGLAERREYRALLDALLLRARFDLGLPLIQDGPLADLAEPVRTQFEDRYVAALRHVGGLLLDAGEIAAAWPYFRAIGEREPVARAIEAFQPGTDDEDEQKLASVVEVAFNEGANPTRGFALILDHFGPCSAITAFDHLPAEPPVRAEAAARLVRRLHADLVANLRTEIGRRGQPLPAEGGSIRTLIDGRDWLFADDSYHIDVSHLASAARLATLITDPAALALAVDLTEYGRRLSKRFEIPGDPPFENTHEDLGSYLGALIGRDVDAAIARLRAKVDADDPDQPDPTLAAMALVKLLARLGRHDEAIALAEAKLGHVPAAMVDAPSVAQLCQAAGQPDRLARIARDRADLVTYAAARLQQRTS